MSSPSPSQYGEITSSTGFLTRATANTQSFFATRRPWKDLFNISYITRPYSIGEATARLKRNINYFRVNYTMIVLGILFVSLLWHPISMIVFFAVFVAWFFLYFFRDEPVSLLGRNVDDRDVLAVLGVGTIVALLFTRVWLNVLVSILVGLFLVLVHAAFRGTDDLYVDDVEVSDGGRLFSFVGSRSPTSDGYSHF